MNVDELIAAVLRREGGFIDHPADKGGATNFGITRKTLSAWRGREVTSRDVQLLTRLEAAEIYAARYYYGAKMDRLPESLQPAMFDACVNHGAGNAWRMLQRALGVAADGIPGEQTFAAVAVCSVSEVLSAFLKERGALYERIAKQDASQRLFLKGWLNRLEEFA